MRFLGRAQRAVVGALLRGAHGVVVPSLREPMGIVTLEAMAAGRALLASAVDGIPEVAPQGIDVKHFYPGNCDSLAEGLRWLAERPHSSASTCNKEHARNFAWDRIAENYLSIYRTVCKVPDPVRPSSRLGTLASSVR